MTDETEDPEAYAILFAMEELQARPGGNERRVPSDEGMATAARLYVETLGLLPYSLAPAEVPSNLRARLLATLTGDETQPSQSLRSRPPIHPPKVQRPYCSVSAGCGSARNWSVYRWSSARCWSWPFSRA